MRRYSWVEPGAGVRVGAWNPHIPRCNIVPARTNLSLDRPPRRAPFNVLPMLICRRSKDLIELGCSSNVPRDRLYPRMHLSRRWLDRDHLDLRLTQPIAVAMHFVPAQRLSPHRRGLVPALSLHSRGTARRTSPFAIIRDPECTLPAREFAAIGLYITPGGRMCARALDHRMTGNTIP